MTFTFLEHPAVSWSRDPQVARDNTWAHFINKHSGKPFSLTGSARESTHSRHGLFGGPIPSRPTKTLESMGSLTKHIPRRSWIYLHRPTASVYLKNVYVRGSERLWLRKLGERFVPEILEKQKGKSSQQCGTLPTPSRQEFYCHKNSFLTCADPRKTLTGSDHRKWSQRRIPDTGCLGVPAQRVQLNSRTSGI